MYRSFNSLDELFAHIKEDKEWTGANAAQHNRYPTRFILFDNFSDFNNFIVNRPSGIYKHSIETMIDQDYPDSFLSYTELSKEIRSFTRRIPVNDFIICPFSEMARFYDNDVQHEFDSLVTTIRGEQPPEDAQNEHVRLYIPIVGMQGKMGKFMNDINAFVWEYKSGIDNGVYTLILTDNTTYGVSGLDENYTVVHNLYEWLKLWEKGESVKQTIICSSANIYANAHHAQPDNAFAYLKCENAFQFLTRGLSLDFGVTEETSEEEMPYWEQLASEIDITTFNFEEFVKERFDTFSLHDGINFIKSWFDCNTDFDRWLLTIYFRKVSTANSYINRVVSQCSKLSKSELVSNIATLIFTEDLNDTFIAERRIAMKFAAEQGVKITDGARQKLKARLTAIAIDPQAGYSQAVKLLTPLTNEEFQLAIEWIAKGQIRIDEIKTVFPNLYNYLQPLSLNSFNTETQWISEYFDAYRMSKITNGIGLNVKKIIADKNANPASFQNWIDNFKTVKTILHNRKDIDVFYWIDGLGVDWIPLIRSIIAKYAKEQIFLNEIYIGLADIPTTTYSNKIKLQSLIPDGEDLPKIGDLDGFAHTAKCYPQYIIDEISIVENAIEKVLDDYNGKKIAFISDHGLTYLSQFDCGLKLAGIKSEHEGRLAKITADGFGKDDKYIILEDEVTVCSLTHHSLTDKVVSGHGAHGGCTPEEVLVPIIIVSSQKNANKYSVKIENDEIDGTNPVLRFTIKGLNSIDVPTLEYNGVTYQLSNVNDNIYESERMSLIDTATKVIVRINDEIFDSFSIKVSTGVAEDNNLFDF